MLAQLHTHAHCTFYPDSSSLYISTQNKKLQQDNQMLRERSDTLAAEKQQLEQLVSVDQNVVSLDPTDFLSALVKESLLESHGSAAPAVSRQQRQVIPAARLIQAWTAIR